eukprot:6824572-Prymnesium_polylepis.1
MCILCDDCVARHDLISRCGAVRRCAVQRCGACGCGCGGAHCDELEGVGGVAALVAVVVRALAVAWLAKVEAVNRAALHAVP